MCEKLELHLNLNAQRIQRKILSDGPLNLAFQQVHGHRRMKRGTRFTYIKMVEYNNSKVYWNFQ